MRAEANAYVEGLVEVQGDGRSELVHGFAFETEIDGEGVASLFEADAFSGNGDETVGARAAWPRPGPETGCLAKSSRYRDTAGEIGQKTRGIR